MPSRSARSTLMLFQVSESNSIARHPHARTSMPLPPEESTDHVEPSNRMCLIGPILVCARNLLLLADADRRIVFQEITPATIDVARSLLRSGIDLELPDAAITTLARL